MNSSINSNVAALHVKFHKSKQNKTISISKFIQSKPHHIYTPIYRIRFRYISWLCQLKHFDFQQTSVITQCNRCSSPLYQSFSSWLGHCFWFNKKCCIDSLTSKEGMPLSVNIVISFTIKKIIFISVNRSAPAPGSSSGPFVQDTRRIGLNFALKTMRDNIASATFKTHTSQKPQT